MHPILVTLIKESIVFAREVLTQTYFVRAPQETIRETTKTTYVHIHEKVLDEETLQKFINQTTKHLNSIIDAQTQLLLEEARKQRVREAIQDVQARVRSLKMLTTSKNLDPNITMQLVITALNPLQVSLEIAKFRIQDYGDQDIWEACYIVGTSALLAGYAFLGQDVSRWQEELFASMSDIQKRILNDTAVKILRAKKEIPWEKVQKLLSPEGVEDLITVYEESLLASVPDINNLEGIAIAQSIKEITDTASLEHLLTVEKQNKNRKTVIDLLNQQIQLRKKTK
ncbi:hypothetical protein [Larkinella rosea]|uniref:Uncharacterized protein n=1 Tax=Larkinella rosea TaxID=2025312 RepID=A0A3P1BTK9_9BACT|nr:hypothetical protein [Larkinella rosea]RRB04441.1 hypothetical protein EHT25_13160 [Larkinella rosea]